MFKKIIEYDTDNSKQSALYVSQSYCIKCRKTIRLAALQNSAFFFLIHTDYHLVFMRIVTAVHSSSVELYRGQSDMNKIQKKIHLF